MVMLLILIPVLCVSLSLYAMNLVSFVTQNNMDVLMLTITIFLSVISSFFIIKLFIRSNENIPFIKNLDNRSNLIHGFFSFIIMFFLGVSLIINSFIYKMDMYNLLIGILIVLTFLFTLFKYLQKPIEIELLLTSIDDTNSYVDSLLFSNDNELFEYFVSKNNNYKEDRVYLCLVDMNSKCIKKIIKELKKRISDFYE